MPDAGVLRLGCWWCIPAPFSCPYLPNTGMLLPLPLAEAAQIILDYLEKQNRPYNAGTHAARQTCMLFVAAFWHGYYGGATG